MGVREIYVMYTLELPDSIGRLVTYRWLASVRPAGLEPVTSSLGRRSSYDVSSDSTDGLHHNESEAYRGAYRNDQHELARVVAAWPLIPRYIKAAITALLEASDNNRIR